MSDVTVSDMVRGNISVKGNVNSLSSPQHDLEIAGNKTRLESFGVKLTPGGAHASRTIMLKEITRLLPVGSAHTGIEEYGRSIVEENVLGKVTAATRKETVRRLRELYALMPTVPIFSVYRELMKTDPSSAPLLSLLVAWSRDPLLRGTTPAVLRATVGERVATDELQQSLGEAYPHQYASTTMGNVARHAASSWTQSGHLTGRTKKIRSRVEPRPAAVTLALMLGHVAGLAGAQLFSSVWCRLLDLNASEGRSLAEQAHRQELITLRAMGSIVEISFPRFRQFLKGF